MRTVLWATLRVQARRYLAAVLALSAGVVFVVVTAGLTSALRSGLVSGLEAPYADADAVVAHPSPRDAVALVAGAEGADARAWMVAGTAQPLRHQGRSLDEEADIGVLPDDPGDRWPVLEAGGQPERPGEALLEASVARSEGITIGDRLRIGDGADSVEVTVAGIAQSPSRYAAADVFLLWPDVAAWQDTLFVLSVAWAGPGDAEQAISLVRTLVPSADVRPRDAALQQLLREVNQGVDVIRILGLLFAAIALVVTVLVVNNTFTILFAQRSRDFALLRCVGATRRQLLRSVRVESLILGIAAAVVGSAAGLTLSHALTRLIRLVWPEAGLGRPEVAAGWVLGAGALAVAVALVASWLPTRRVAATSAIAALRPDDSTTQGTRTGRLRLLTGALGVGVGSALLAGAVITGGIPVMLAGGTLTFGSIVLLGPVLVPLLIRLVDRAAGRVFGPTARLAGENAIRDPRRTAATTASLLIGVTLTTAVLAGLASSRTALSLEMARQHPVDVAVVGATALPADLADRAAAAPGAKAALAVPGAMARIAGSDPLPVLAAPDARDASAMAVLRADAIPHPGQDEIVLPWLALPDGVRQGDRVAVEVAGRTAELEVVLGDGWGEAGLIAAATLIRLAPAAEPMALWVRAEPDADPDDLGVAVDLLAGRAAASVENGLAAREYVDFQLDVLTGAVVGMLAISIAIALVGIANTLGLSVLERGREHALLRALGLTRRQLRRMLAAEALLLSGVAAVLGSALGLTFAWVGVRTMVAPVLDGAGLELPWAQFALVIVSCLAAGLLACVLPARRAARVPPASGLVAL